MIENVVKLDNYYAPQDLMQAISEFVDYFNNHRYHEPLKNLTPANVYFGRDREILRKRRKIKEETLRKRCRNYAFIKLELRYTRR